VKIANVSETSRLEYCSLGLRGIPGARRPIVLLNGSLCNFSQWERFISTAAMRELVETHGVVLYNYSGYGQSVTTPATDSSEKSWNIDTLADELVQLLDYLDLGSAHLFGVSKGTGVLQVVAHRHPERVASLAGYGWINLHHSSAASVSGLLRRRLSQMPQLRVDDCEKPLTRKVFALLWESLYREIITGSRTRKSGVSGMLLDNFIREKAFNLISPMSVDRMVKWFEYAAYLYSAPPVSLDLSMQALSVAPIRIFHGKGDRLLPPEAVQALSNRLPQGAIELLPSNFSHVSPLFLRAQANSLAQQYQAFINTIG
jgi:pimeloyl-ACP methyl ester carboxylesterase